MIKEMLGNVKPRMDQFRTDALQSRSFDANDPQSARLAAEIAEANLKGGAKDDSAISDSIKPFADYNYWKVPDQYDLEELMGEMSGSPGDEDKQKKEEGGN